jgi:hypothetical protein
MSQQSERPPRRGFHQTRWAPSERTLFAVWDTIDRVRDQQGEPAAHEMARKALAAIVAPASDEPRDKSPS